NVDVAAITRFKRRRFPVGCSWPDSSVGQIRFSADHSSPSTFHGGSLAPRMLETYRTRGIEANNVTTALGKSVALKDSSLPEPNRFYQIQGEWVWCSQLLFPDCSNKKVNVSSAGMARAKQLLGLEEEDEFSVFKHVNHRLPSSHQQHGTPETFGAEHRSVTPGGHNFISKGSSNKVSNCWWEIIVSVCRSLESCQKPSWGTLNNGLGGDIAHESNKHTSNSFISPLQSSSKQFRSVKLEDLPGYLIKKFDAAVDETHGNTPLASDKAVLIYHGTGFIPDLHNLEASSPATLTIDKKVAKKKRLGKDSLLSCDTHIQKGCFLQELKKKGLQEYISRIILECVQEYDHDNMHLVMSSSSKRGGAETFHQMLQNLVLPYNVHLESGSSGNSHATRHNPAKCRGNFLTITNVLQELRYREGQSWSLLCNKEVLSGDASASSMMVSAYLLLIQRTRETHGSDSGNNVKIELTDGWYSINAALDVMLQTAECWKIILGARLSGWSTPTSPLEAAISNTISLLLNINGTYRAHWADRLGFCKEVGVPLALNCIKCNGALLGEKKSVVRSERMEWRMIELHTRGKRSDLIEGLICEYQGGINGVDSQNDTDSKEGAKLLSYMSMEELNCFNRYKESLRRPWETRMEKSVAKLWKTLWLSERDVTPFMRIRLVGLTSLSYDGHPIQKKGHFNNLESNRHKNRVDRGENIRNEGAGSSSRLQPLSPKALKDFMNLIWRRTLYMLEMRTRMLTKRSSGGFLQMDPYNIQIQGKSQNRLLAISFRTSSMDDLHSPLISHNLVGSVGFLQSNKRAKDVENDMWMLLPSHLKTSSGHIQIWATSLFLNPSIIDQFGREPYLLSVLVNHIMHK
ncbi:LOW QUALITY PROTEIN: hypothetical protein HID58_092041, partial [Brassica napus]